jgi:hypothetical protein
VNKPEPVAASAAEKCGRSDEVKTVNNAESVHDQSLETEQTQQAAAAEIEQVEDPALRQQLELQQLQLELDMSSALANMIGSLNLSSFV